MLNYVCVYYKMRILSLEKFLRDVCLEVNLLLENMERKSLAGKVNILSALIIN